jgi:ferredoxin-NADP reductase
MYLSRNAREFTFEPQAEKKNYAAFAAGSGITP